MSGPRRSVWVLPLAVVAIGVLLVAVFPTRTFLAQQASVHAAGEQLAVLAEGNSHLEERLRQLDDDAVMEIILREYGYVRPGEEAFAVLPEPTSRAPLPPVGTRPALPVDDRNPLEKARDWVADGF